MTIDELLPHLQSVRPRGNGRWSARCPSHTDKSPSLSVSEGVKGLLLRCWAGCSLDEICAALHIKQQDLFYESHDRDPARRRAAAMDRDRRVRAREAQAEQHGAIIDALKAADYFVRSRRELDIAGWSDQRLADELHALADAYTILESESFHE